jgi:hypothetical protein
MELTTPAVLVSMLSLMLLASTNRFLGLANRTRDLCDRYLHEPRETIERQIRTLRRRIQLVRNIQTLQVLSLALFATCMLFVFNGRRPAAELAFETGLGMALLSLLLSLVEIWLSTQALNLQIENLQVRSGL